MKGDNDGHDLIGRRIGTWTVVRRKRRATDGRNVFIVSDGTSERALRGYQLVRQMHEARRNGLYVSPSTAEPLPDNIQNHVSFRLSGLVDRGLGA